MKENGLILRLLLRSVYLKGHQDGNLKTSDMSWEDKILSQIIDLIIKKLPKDRPTWKEYKEGRTTDWVELGNEIHNQGFNDCLTQVKTILEEMRGE